MKFRTLFLLCILGLGVGLAVVSRMKNVANSNSDDVKVAQKYVELAPLNVLVVQEDTENQEKRVLFCKQSCELHRMPIEAQDGAFTDGASWYYYAVKNALTGLFHVPVTGGEAKSIIVENPLLRPRGIFISPSAKKVVYFLDNIVEAKKKLTELWAYDTATQAVSVLQENLQQEHVLSRLRFNAAGNALWYVANAGTSKDQKLQLMVVPTEGGSAAAKFSKINWQELQEVADKGVMDISADTSAVALASPSGDHNDTLIVTRDTGGKQSAKLAGTIVFVQWLKDNTLLYALQTSGSFSFWHLEKERAVQIVSHPGVLRSARSDLDGQYIALAADTLSSKTQLFTLEVASGLLKDQAIVPAFGQNVFVVQVNALPPTKQSAVAGITSTFSDDQIVPFIEKNIGAMANANTAMAVRLLFTNVPNTLFVDFVSGVQRGRILLSVNDIVNPEWKVLARYNEINTQWHLAEGNPGKEPAVVRIYEWEETLKKWILKSGK